MHAETTEITKIYSILAEALVFRVNKLCNTSKLADYVIINKIVTWKENAF